MSCPSSLAKFLSGGTSLCLDSFRCRGFGAKSPSARLLDQPQFGRERASLLRTVEDIGADLRGGDRPAEEEPLGLVAVGLVENASPTGRRRPIKGGQRDVRYVANIHDGSTRPLYLHELEFVQALCELAGASSAQTRKPDKVPGPKVWVRGTSADRGRAR